MPKLCIVFKILTSGRWLTVVLPGLGEDHIVYSLFILGQFESMHLAGPIRKRNLKHSIFKFSQDQKGVANSLPRRSII